jgi:hypothetical protein
MLFARIPTGRVGNAQALFWLNSKKVTKSDVKVCQSLVPIVDGDGWRKVSGKRAHHGLVATDGLPDSEKGHDNVTDIEGSRLCWIQVKTRRDLGSDGGWHMNAKRENLRSGSTPA